MMFLMSIAPLPSPLQHLGGRRFAFYPPIRNIRHNEWMFRSADWSECVVINTQSGDEIAVPRTFLGEVTHGENPGMVVSLTRELACENGLIVPHDRRVIELPVARHEIEDVVASRPAHRAPVVSIRLEPKSEIRAAGKWIGVALVLGAVALTIVSDFTRQSQGHARSDLFRNYRGYLQLDSADDYQRTVRKLGVPAAEKATYLDGHFFRSLAYRVPGYRGPRYTVVLMGASDDDARYIGTLSMGSGAMRGHVLDSVRLPGGAGSDTLLRALPAF
jgi:hypothetical protein